MKAYIIFGIHTAMTGGMLRSRQMWKQWSETEYKRNSMPSRYPNAIPFRLSFSWKTKTLLSTSG